VETTCEDVAAPVVVLLGEPVMEVRSCKVCDINEKGRFDEPGFYAFDFNDGTVDVTVEEGSPHDENGALVVIHTYRAKDKAGNVAQATRKVIHIQNDISKAIEDMRRFSEEHYEELVKYKDQLKSLESWFSSVYTWTIQITVFMIVCFILWILITAEGWRLFKAVCLQISHPDQSWAAIQADLDREEIERHHNKMKNSRGQVNN
jgi:hypothetical protein